MFVLCGSFVAVVWMVLNHKHNARVHCAYRLFSKNTSIILDAQQERITLSDKLTGLQATMIQTYEDRLKEKDVEVTRLKEMVDELSEVNHDDEDEHEHFTVEEKLAMRPNDLAVRRYNEADTTFLSSPQRTFSSESLSMSDRVIRANAAIRMYDAEQTLEKVKSLMPEAVYEQLSKHFRHDS